MIEMIGRTFGLLTVIKFHGYGTGTRKRPHWFCKCSCGGKTVASGSNIRQGSVRSCGCLQRDGTTKGNYSHGLHGTAVLATWRHMMGRCYDPDDKSYSRYGGRGITVCKLWHDPLPFLADVGHQPRKGMSIDRINNDGNYEPGNVRWTNALQQSNNRSTNIFHTLNGVTHTQAEWCAIFKMKQPTVCVRLKRGWSIERALTTPVV